MKSNDRILIFMHKYRDNVKQSYTVTSVVIAIPLFQTSFFRS